MTAATVSAPAASVRRDARVTFPRVLRSEWTKFYSLRSTYWTLLAAVVILAGLGALITYGIMSQEEVQLARRAGLRRLPPGLGFDLVSISFQGINLSQLAIGVLGVLMVTGEYSTGMIRATFAAVPRRLPVVLAKAIVMAVTTFVVMVPAAILTFYVGQGILGTFGGEITDPGVIRAVIGAGLYLVVIGLMGVAFGWILRSAAGAISTLVAIVIILPILVQVIPVDWIKAADPYLPSRAGQAIYWVDTTLLKRFAEGSLDPWPGFALFAAYAVALLVVAAVVVKRRDA